MNRSALIAPSFVFHSLRARMSAGTIVAAQRSSVPSGVRVTWSQRRDTVIVAVEFPSDSEEPQVSFSDCGLVAVQAAAAPSGERWDVQLQCSHKIDAAQSRRLCPHRPTGTRAVSPLRPGMCAGEAAQLVSRVRRWMATERSVRMVLQKLAVVRWDRLVEGERLARLRVDGKYPGAGAP